MQYANQMVMNMKKEMVMRANEIASPLQSIYFGGGTPSVLSEEQFSDLFHSVFHHFKVTTDAEITVECNPDDLDEAKLNLYKKLGVTRLSIGIQSFDDACLQRMNRVHNAATAELAIKQAIKAGFTQLTIDLIYGIPGVSDLQLQQDLEKAIAFGIQHISAYCLTVEPNTALHHLIKTGKYLGIDDEHALRQFELLTDFLAKAGFEQYEISNYARNGAYSKHNTAYWKGIPYIGIGPSAHSFNGHQRSWNIADNQQYMRQLEQGVLPFELENLSENERYNEAVMTGLRTIWGCNLNQLKKDFPIQVASVESIIQMKIDQGVLTIQENHLKLTPKGKFLADGIASDLFA